MKYTKVLLALLSISMLLFAACAAPAPEPQPEPVVETAPEPEPEPTPEPEPEVEEEPVEPATEELEGRRLEPEVCTTDAQPHQIHEIVLDVEDGPVRRTEGGFYLKVFPKTELGEVVPATGSYAVHVWRTVKLADPKQEGRLEKDGDEVFLDSFYRKAENVGSDCAPEEIFVPFDQYNKDRMLKHQEGDPGMILVKARIGSAEFQKVYTPEGDESFMP